MGPNNEDRVSPSETDLVRKYDGEEDDEDDGPKNMFLDGEESLM